MQRIRYSLALACCGLLMLVALFAPASATYAAAPAQPAGLTISVTAGFDGNYKLGEWFPVQVELANNGANFSGQVQIQAFDQKGAVVSNYAREIDLPSPSRKQITLYTYSASFQRDFTLRLLSGNNVVAQQQIKVTPLEEPAFIVGVVADDAALLNVLNGQALGAVSNIPTSYPSSSSSGSSTAKTTVAHMTVESIPTSAEGMAGLDALIFAGSDTSKLSAEQITALSGWVTRGGALVVAGDSNTSGATTGLAGLLPVSLNGSKQAAEFPSLVNFAGSGSALSGAALLAVGQPLAQTGATVLAGETDTPLLVRREMGEGQVLFLALDPNAAPLKNWDGTAALWQTAFATQDVRLSPGGWRRMQQSYNYYYYGDTGSPFNLPGLDLPSTAVVGLFLLVYVVILGPLNFIVLRRLKRTELAWITIPALILVFAIGAYFFGRQSRGTALYLAQNNIIRAFPDSGVAAVESFTGLFSPDRRSYDVSFNTQVELSEIDSSGYGASASDVSNPATILQGSPTTLHDLNLNTWSLRGFLSEGTVAYSSPFTASLQLQNGRITGTLKNTSQQALQDVGVFSDSNLQVLGTVGAGQTKAIDLLLGSGGSVDDLAGKMFPALQQYSYSYNSSQSKAERDASRKASMLNTGLFDEQASSYSNKGVQLGVVGWGAPEPFQVQIAGSNPQRDELNMVVSMMPVEVASGAVDLPGGAITRRIVSGSVSSPNSQSGMQMDYDAVVFGFTIPGGIKMQELSLHYDVNMNYGEALPVAVFNWQSNKWDELGDNANPLITGQSGKGDIAIDNLDQHISPNNEVQIKLGDDSQSYYNTTINAFELSGKGTK